MGVVGGGGGAVAPATPNHPHKHYPPGTAALRRQCIAGQAAAGGVVLGCGQLAGRWQPLQAACGRRAASRSSTPAPWCTLICLSTNLAMYGRRLRKRGR